MPRKRKVNDTLDEVLDMEPSDSVSYSDYSGVHGHGSQHLIDPLTPLPGGVKLKQVREQRPPKRKSVEAAESKRIYSEYARELVANGGDEIAALAQVLNLSTVEVEANRFELHNKVMEQAGSGRSLRTLLAENDLSKETRIRILRSHAFNSSNPAASLKALQLVDELDQERIADVNSYESYLRDLMGDKRKRI